MSLGILIISLVDMIIERLAIFFDIRIEIEERNDGLRNGKAYMSVIYVCHGAVTQRRGSFVILKIIAILASASIGSAQ